MNLKALLLTTAIALPLALPAAAFPPGDDRVDEVIEALGLEGARADQVRQIMDSHHEEKKTLHKEMREKMKAMHQAHQQDLEGVLTPEELDKLQAMKEEKVRKHRKHFGGERHWMKRDTRDAE